MESFDKFYFMVIFLLASHCHNINCQDETDILRLSRRSGHNEGVNAYKTSVIHTDNNRKHSFSTVTVQLNLNDKQVISESDEDYVTAPANDDYQINKAQIKKPNNYNENNVDNDSGASNNHIATRYVLPPENFMNQMKQEQIRYSESQQVQQVQHSTPSPISRSNQQQYVPGPQIQFVTTPAPQYSSTPRQFFANAVNYQSAPSQVQYVSNNNQYQVNQEQQFNNQQNNVRYVQAPSQRVQYASSPAPQFVQEQQNQVQYVSTPSPNVQYASTPPTHEHYVSSPVHFASTPSPAQYTTGGPVFANRINQISNDKQMHIDHFDNAMSGVRSPKFNLQSSNNVFTSTPAPLVVSTTPSPIVQRSEEPWRNAFNNNINLQQEPQQSPIQFQANNNNFQDQSLNLNAVESSNNFVFNSVGPQVRHRFQMGKVNQQRDVEKDTDVPNAYSNGDFGWKLAPKKLANNDQSSVSVTTFSSVNNQPVNLQAAPFEYKPFPNNPFLNHISYQSPVPPKSTSVQSISFQPDNNQQQNVNVGYSIGFSNNVNNINQEILKAEPSVYANKYPFMNNLPSYTTSFPGVMQNDVVKGVNLSPINQPEQPSFLKDPNQEYSFKFNDKLSQGYAYNVPAAQYKISHNLKADSQIVSGLPKAVSYQASSPNILATYHGSEVKNDGKTQAFKWTNISPGVEVATGSVKPLIVEDAPSPNPIIYFNNPNDVVTNTPYYYSTPKDPNTVSFTPTPLPDTSNPVTISPHYINGINQIPPQLNQIPQSHVIQHYPQEQANIHTASLSSQNYIDQSGVLHYKPVDQSFYNIQNIKPNNVNDLRSTYMYGKPREQFAYEPTHQQQLIQGNYILPSVDMLGHASNVETKHISNMIYVPSETFRQQNYNRDLQSDQSSSVQVTRIQPDGATNYQHHIRHGEDLQGQYTNNYDRKSYDGHMNQNLNVHNIEPYAANSDSNYVVVKNNNQRTNEEEITYEHPNEVDGSDGTLTTINGIKIVNPYNIDLKIVSDMLRGKAAVDESRLEPMREQMSRLNPIKLDTAALQDVVAKSEQVQEAREPMKSREYIDGDQQSLRMEKYKAVLKQKNFKEFPDPRPFHNSFETKDEGKYQHSVPNIASEQLHTSLQSVLSAHEIGSVIEQQPKTRSRVRDSIGFDAGEFNKYLSSQDGEDQPNGYLPEDHKHLKHNVEQPYPLLKPPRMPIQRSMKKSEKRLIGARHNRLLGHRHNRPSKTVNYEETDEFDPKYKIQTELRPPPVNQKKIG